MTYNGTLVVPRNCVTMGGDEIMYVGWLICAGCIFISGEITFLILEKTDFKNLNIQKIRRVIQTKISNKIMLAAVVIFDMGIGMVVGLYNNLEHYFILGLVAGVINGIFAFIYRGYPPINTADVTGTILKKVSIIGGICAICLALLAIGVYVFWE